MTSRRQRQSKPIESVELRISFKTDKATAERIRAAVPSAIPRAGGCEVIVTGDRPGEVAEKARVILAKLKATIDEGRKSESPEKDFKQLESVGINK